MAGFIIDTRRDPFDAATASNTPAFVSRRSVFMPLSEASGEGAALHAPGRSWQRTRESRSMFEIHVNQNSGDIKPKKRKVEST
jgi:hypothetical protein